jgi:hypothetical protein
MPIPCHVHTGAQCAGSAIYRANVCKQGDDDCLELEADRKLVFATPNEFSEHHQEKPLQGPLIPTCFDE